MQRVFVPVVFPNYYQCFFTSYFYLENVRLYEVWNTFVVICCSQVFGFGKYILYIQKHEVLFMVELVWLVGPFLKRAF